MDESLSKNRVLPQRPYFSTGGGRAMSSPAEAAPPQEEKIQDRIRRAIERNKAREEASASRLKTSALGGGFKNFAQKEEGLRDDGPPPLPGQGGGSKKLQELKERLKAKHQEKFSTSGPSYTQTAQTRASSGPSASASHSSFLPRPIKEESTTGRRLRQKWDELNPTVKDWAIKGGWFFCFVLLLRLVFAENGVLDYFKMEKVLGQKATELTSIKAENFALMEEIEKIQKDQHFQKKLVRENLGYIAHDEYLVLFAKESPTEETTAPRP